MFATNVTGASLFTAAALPHLQQSRGRAVYLSSVSASFTAPWPGLGAYIVSKAALERLVEVWRTEHPTIGFTRVVVGDCVGGEGEGTTEFPNIWDPERAAEFGTEWVNRGLIAGCFVEVDHLVSAVDGLLRSGASMAVPSMVVAPRPQS